METEAKVPEDESATNFTLIESTTMTERVEVKFPQKNGNDFNPKYPLVEETGQAHSGKTGEICVTGPQEIYQNLRKASAESEKHAEHQPEGHSTEVIKHSNAEELVVMEIITKSSVPEDKALSTLPNISSIQVERVDESIQDEIQKEAKSAMTDKKEQQESEKDFEEKEEVPEAFDLHEVTGKSCTENEKQDEPQSEAQSLETDVVKNPNLEEEITEINSSNDTKQHEMVWESHLGETVDIIDGGEFIKEEANEMEEVTNMQLLKTATESVLDNEAPILSTSAFAKGETDDEVFQKQTLKEEESATKENESCGPESKLEQATKAVEANDPPETVGDFGGDNEEQTDHRSEAPISQSTITKHSVLEGLMTIESSTKSSYDIEEPGKIPDSHTIDNSEIKDGGKSLLEETVYIREPIDVELQKSETESAPEDKAQSALLTTVCHIEETLDESTQEEIHKEVESAVADTKKELTSENNFEKKKNEDFDLHEVARENEKKEEPQPEAQSLETIIIKHQNFGVSTEINPSNDNEVLEMAPASFTEEKLVINVDGKFVLEKAKEIKEATDMQLTESATESVSDDEAQSALPKSTTVIGEKVDEILQEQTLKEEESTAIDNSDSCTPENQVTQTDKFVEQIGLLETIGKVAAVNEEHADNQSESPALDSVIINDTLSEGLVTMESQSSTTSSYDVEVLKKIPESHFVENSENMDIENTALEEAIYIKEATNVELPNSNREKVVGVATAEEICEEEIHMKAGSAVTDTKEEQRPENDFEKKKEVPKAININAAVGNIFVETKSEVLNQETTVINHQNLGETTETNTGNGTEEFEIIAPSHTGVKTEAEDCGKFIEEKAKDMEEATITQLLKTATESVPGDEAPSTLLSSAIIRGETAQEIFQEQTVKEEESTVIETQDGCKAENEQEQMAKNDELNQVVNLPIAMGKVNEENEEHHDHKSEVKTWESVITKHTISEGLAAKEISTNSSYDLEQQEKISEHTAENSDINDSDKISPEEAIYVKEATEADLRNSEVESVPEDKALSTLPSTASVEVETVNEPIQEEIHKEGESTVTDAKDIKEGARPEKYFEENKNVLEAFEQQETTTENEKKDDPQLEVQSLQTIDIEHPNLEGETTETKPCNDDSETNEEVSASPKRDKLEIKEGGNHTKEEEKLMEETTDMQLLETATESFDDEGSSILPKLSIVKDEMVEETFLLQTLKDEEPVATDNTGRCMPENDLEQTAKVIEDFDTLETMGKVGAKNEEHADDESQPSGLENTITKNTNSEGMTTTKDSTKTSNEVEEQEKIPRSHTVEDSEIKDSSKTLQEQTISMKEAAVDSQKFETESNIAIKKTFEFTIEEYHEPIGVETVKESIQEEIHKEGESTVTNTKEGQTPEDDFEETFELHEAKGNIPQSEALSLQTIAIKHLDLGDATEININNDSEENEQLPASHTSEKLEIKDGEKFILEGEKEKEEAIEMQLQESTKEMTGDDEAPSTFPTAAMTTDEVVDKVFQEQTFTEVVPAAIDKDGSSGLENELVETAQLVEAIDLTETKGKVGAENEEQADHQSKVPSLETQKTRHSNSEGTVTMEGSTTSYEVEQDKIPESLSLDNLENKDGVKTLPVQAIHNNEATYAELPKSETESLPEDQAMSTLSTTISVGVETVEESIREEVHREEESEMTETKVGLRPESDFEEEKKVPEDLDLHKTDNTCVETQMKYEVQSLETTAIEHPYSEADTKEITTSNDMQEREEVLASHTSEKSEIKDKGEFILEEGKGEDKGIERQLEEYAKESVPDDETSSTLPTSATVKDETADETIQELTFKKEDSEVVDTNGSFRHDETAKVVKELDIPKTMGKVDEEKEQYADYQSEFPMLENPITQHTDSDGIVTVEGSTKTRYGVEEQERVPESHSVEKSDVKDGGRTLPDEAIYIKQATHVELPKSQTESMPEDKALSALPTTASLRVETVEASNQKGIQEEAESAGTDTEERQRPENDFDEKKKVPEAFDMHEETVNTCVENKKEEEPQFEAQSLETTAADHPDLKGDTKETDPSNDAEEYVQVPASHTAEELEIKDTEKFKLEESKEMEVSTGMQLQESTKESVLGDEASLTLPTSAVAKGEIVEEIIQQQTLHEEESAAKDLDRSSRTENELDKAAEVYEGNDLPETMGKVQTEKPTLEITITRHTISEELVTTEISTESSHDGEYLGEIPESYALKSSEMRDSEKTLLEEAADVDLPKSKTEIVSEDKAMSILPSTAPAGVDIIEESIQEEIHEEVESAATDTEAGHSPENYLVDKEEDFEAFDLHKSTAGNEPHLEVQSQENMVIMHPNLEGENREMLGYDTDDLKQLPVSLIEEKSEIKDEWRFVQAEAKAMEEATVIQLLDSTKESVTDDEAPSTLPAMAIVKAGVVKEEESATIDYDQSYMPEKELEQTTTDVEARDLPKIMGKVGAQNEEYTTKHTILEGLKTKDISTESNYDGETMEKILKSHPVDSFQIKGDEKTVPEEATCINKATYVELKSETESIHEDKTLSTFLTTASIEVKKSEESIQVEIHQQMVSSIPETKEGQQPEIDYDKRTKFSEASHLHEATLENKKIDELHFEEHSQETIIIENPNLEGDITETNPYNDTEEPEQVPAANTEEKLVMKDGEKIIHEEAKVIEETNVMQLPESAEGSIPDDKASSTLPTSAIGKGEGVEDIIQEQTLKEEKSAAIDNDGSCRPENEVAQIAKVIEAIDLPEIMGKVGDENKEPADYQSEVCTLETAIKEHKISEGLETTEIITESSYDVEQLQNIPELHNVDNSKIFDGQNTMVEEAIYIKEATNLESPNTKTKREPEDNALSTSPTIATVGVETTEESIQDEINKDAKPAITTTKDGQRRENYFDEKKEVQKVDLQEETPGNERMHEYQSEVQSLETTTALEHPVLGGGPAKTDKINDTEELEHVPASRTEKKLEIKDGAKFIEEKAIDMEEAINVQFPGSEKESVPDDKAPSTLPTSIVKGEMAEEFFQDQSPKIEKSASTDNDGSRRPENEFEQTEKVFQAIDLPQTMGKVAGENREHPDHQSRALTSDTAISKHTIAEGLEAIETSKESSYNVEEPEQNPESHSMASVRVESIEQSIHEKIHTEAESALADTEGLRRPENDFKEKKTVVEEIDPFEAAAEYVKKDEPHSEAQSTAAMDMKHPNIGGTTETNLSNDIDELQQVPTSDSTQNLEIKEGGKYTQEEAEKIEDATGMLLTQSAKESVADDESLSTMAEYEIVKCETVDESVQEQTFTEETLAAIDNQWSYRPENELEKTVEFVKEINLPETKIKEGEKNDKDGTHQSEAPALETVITKHAISEGLETMEIHTKSSYNVEELENIPESHFVENSKIKDGGKTVPVEVIDINEATAAESAKFKAESMPEGKVLLTLPTTALVGVETIEESIQEEIHNEAELTLTDLNENWRPEYDFEEKKTIPKAFDLHNATAENEKKDEPQFEVQSLETAVIKHATLEGDTTETKPSGDTEEQEQGPVSYTAEKSDIQDVGKSILVEEKEMEEANDIQLEESAKESIPGDENPSMFPKSMIVKAERLEEIFQEQTIEEEESAAIDNGSSMPENELEQTAKVVEAIDLPKTMDKVSVENEEHAKNQSKSPTMATTIRSYTTSAGLAKMPSSTESSYEVDALQKIPEKEGLVKMVSSTETSYEVEALEKIPDSSEGLVKMASSTEPSYEVDALETIPESQSVENSEIKDCGETPVEETTDVQLLKSETESVPEDKSGSTLPTTAPVGAEISEESTQENIHMDDKSALTNTRDWQKPDNGLAEKKNVPEAFDQHQATSNTSEENEKKDELQSEVQTAEPTVTKFDGETTDKNPNSYTEELAMVPASHTRAEIEIKDGGKFMQEEEKEMEEATCTQLPISAKPSVPNEEAPSTMSTSAIVKGESELVEEIFQEQALKEEGSAATYNNWSCRPKNKLEQSERVVEEIDLPGTMGKLSAENEKHTDHQSEAPTLSNVITTHTNSEGMETMDSSIKSSYDVKQQEKNLEAHSIDNSKNKDAGKTSPEEAIYIKEATNVELAKLKTRSVPEDKSLSTLLTTEAVRVEIVDESTQINIQKVMESAVTDTNEEHRPEQDFEENKVPQAFDVHGVTRNTCAENKKKDEPQSKEQSLETIIVKNPNMEGKTIETNPDYYTKELETVPSSSTREILDMKDGGKFIQEEARENKEATGMQLLETAPASVPAALPKLPRSSIVKGETVDEIFEDHTLKEEESAAIDNKKSCRPENQIEQEAEVVEVIGLIESMGKVSAQNKEHADFQSEALALENVVSKHTISEGMLTTESSTKSSYDVEKLEKLPQSHTPEISEIKNDVESPHEEAKYVKEATNVELHKPEAESVPKDKALSTTNTISVRVKTVEECIKQEIHKEAESAVTDDKEKKRQEDNFEKEKVPEAFNLHEETGNTFVEHEKNAEIQSEERFVETMLIKLPNFDGLETKNISPNKNTEELEKFSASHTGEKLEVEEKERDMQLPKSKIEIAAKLDAYEQSDIRESAMMGRSELPAEKISIPEPPYPSKKVESYPDHEVHDLIKEQLPQAKENSYNIQDQISQSDDHIQGHIPQCEGQIKPEPQMEAEHHSNVPLSAKETSVVGLITKDVHDRFDRAGTTENIEDEQTIDSRNSLAEAQISSTAEETVNQVKDEITKNLKATDPDDDDEQKAKPNLSIENDPTEKEAAAYRDTDEVIESPKEEEGGDEFEKISPSSTSGTVMVKGSRDTDVKVAPHKKPHGILSGVGSKVKHSISKVKKAITGKSSHPKTQSPK